MSNLIDNPEVIMYLNGDLSFLPKKTKEAEDRWGRLLMGKDPDAKKPKQWSGPFGEQIFKEFLKHNNIIYRRPKKINNLVPDLESDNYIFEVKNGTYFTTGTAHEKLLGVPTKYGSVPRLYNKPLFIITMNRAEQYMKNLGFFNNELIMSPECMEDVNYWKR